MRYVGNDPFGECVCGLRLTPVHFQGRPELLDKPSTKLGWLNHFGTFGPGENPVGNLFQAVDLKSERHAAVFVGLDFCVWCQTVSVTIRAASGVKRAAR